MMRLMNSETGTTNFGQIFSYTYLSSFHKQWSTQHLKHQDKLTKYKILRQLSPQPTLQFQNMPRLVPVGVPYPDWLRARIQEAPCVESTRSIAFWRVTPTFPHSDLHDCYLFQSKQDRSLSFCLSLRVVQVDRCTCILTFKALPLHSAQKIILKDAKQEFYGNAETFIDNSQSQLTSLRDDTFPHSVFLFSHELQ